MNITINILWLIPAMSLCTSLGVFISALIISGKEEQVEA
jgi:hypothetical protein